MTRFLRFVWARLKRLGNARVPIPALTIGRVMASLSVLGVVGLAYLCGAAVMFFQLPSYDFLDKAFLGAKAWRERGRSSIPSRHTFGTEARPEGITVDKAEKTSDGFTLYTMTAGAEATLIDMRGTVVHHWALPFSRAWSHAPHVKGPLPDNQIHWFHCHLFPNGDLLAIYHADGDTPYGYGLVKLDKDSKLLWAYANNVHHDVEVGEDGTIYTLTHQLVTQPPAGLEFLAAPYLADSVVVLSPEGRELENIPIVEAFANSPYALALSSGSRPLRPTSSSGPNGSQPPDYSRSLDWKNDLLHTNSVKVLSRTLAAKFPLFKPGQVLISLRNLDTIAVLDRHTRRVAWAAQGLWRNQHDAEFLDNGHLLLYDNFGSLRETRILEYDPLTQAIPWAYTNEHATHFSAFYRGMKQRLPNGNTLIVDPDNRRLFEVTRDKELVWESICPLPPVLPGQDSRDHAVNGARRYSAGELTFLKGEARVRP
jgi:Arylsulfotransferase (ASST)